MGFIYIIFLLLSNLTASCLTLFFSDSCCSCSRECIHLCALFHYFSPFSLSFPSLLLSWFSMSRSCALDKGIYFTWVAGKPHTQKPFGCRGEHSHSHSHKAMALLVRWRQVSGISEKWRSTRFHPHSDSLLLFCSFNHPLCMHLINTTKRNDLHKIVCSIA